MSSQILTKLLQRKHDFTVHETSSKLIAENIRALPPFESQIALLNAHNAKWKQLAILGAAMAFVTALSSFFIVKDRLFQKMNSEYIVVPGAAEFMRVRPNLIPDSVVKDFAQYIATYAGNFTYRSAKEHFETVAERMAPELKGRFLRDAETKFSEWHKRRVDQVFSFEPIEIHVANDKFGAKYALVVNGRKSQYADGTLLQETEENLYLELRPRLTLNPGRRSDESLLIVERLEWVSRMQAESLISGLEKSQKNLAKNEGDAK